MPFDGVGDDEDEDELARIDAGGLPREATHRLQAGAGAGFSSGLSVAGFAVLDRMGPRPLAQVTGASVFQVGWQYLDPGSSTQLSWQQTTLYELEAFTRSWDRSRRRALDRIIEEARLVGADAVVGVRLRRGDSPMIAGSVECLVTGTAIRFPGDQRADWPAVTDLSVADYWQLYQAGYESVGLVASTAVVFLATAAKLRLERFRAAQVNQEYPELSSAFFAARDTVRGRLLGQARVYGADGIVGMAFEQHMRHEEFHFAQRAPTVTGAGAGGGGGDGRSGLMITFHGAGTAIRRTAAVERHPPETVVSLGGIAS